MLPIDYREYRPKLNAMFKALACPARRRVLKELAHDIESPTEIAATVGVSPPTVIHHIRVLREAGLVEPNFCDETPAVDRAALEALIHYLRGIG